MELTHDQLRRQADETSFGFASTADLEAVDGALAQRRAEHALDFAMSMRFEGYNLYALGAPQIDMHDFTRERLGPPLTRLPTTGATSTTSVIRRGH